MGIAHRDLKPDKLLISRNEANQLEVKIAGLGLAKFMPEHPQKVFEMCGTPCYIAPEVLSGRGYTEKCDIFSIGSIMFNMITSRYLFGGESRS